MIRNSKHLIACWPLWLSFVFLSAVIAQDPVVENPAGETTRQGYLVQISLPITETVAARVKQQIQQVAEKVPDKSGDEKPVLILEFDTSNGVTGQGSELGNCLNIALLLTDQKLRKLYKVAYVPRSQGYVNRNLDGPASQLKGHPILVALACDEIAMHNDSAIGQAGIDIDGDASLEVANYSNIVGRRYRVPLPVAKALVDQKESLHLVETSLDGQRFVNRKEFDELSSAGQIDDSSTLSGPGDLPMFTSQQMLQMQLIRNRVLSSVDLARRLDVDPGSLEQNSLAGKQWQPVQLPVGNFIDTREADWTIRILTQHLNSNPDTNLVIVRLNSPGGEIEPCLRIARELAKLQASDISSVAYVESTATGPSSLIALGCDQVIMSSEAEFCGSGDQPIEQEALEDSRGLIKRFAEQRQIDWSVPMGLVDPDLQVASYRNKQTGQIRLLCEEERTDLPQANQWTKQNDVRLGASMSGVEAQRLNLSRSTFDDFEQLKQYYQLTETPIELEPSPTDRWIEDIARQLATPWVAAWLLFGAVFLLSTEMSNPGIGIPGFLGTICLMLFFWSQYLDGNAHWLEIMLFAVGMVFIVLEVFVIPGFGVFGIGGLLMVIVSIVLASQTFIWPRNSEELAQLPTSLMMVIAAGSGFFAGIFVIRKYMTTIPFFRRIMLDPPGADDSVSPTQRDKRESLVDRSHMLGKTGQTITPLVPAGKAQIGNELIDVITDGRLVERDQPIKVVEVVGNRVIVEPDE